MKRQENDRQLPLLVSSLKRMLRTRGMGYREIAQTLGVSEPTIKRWFAGKALTVERLESLCACADVSLIELVEFATRDADARQRQLSVEQEQALADDRDLSFIFVIIMRGWSPAELWAEQGFDPATLVSFLMKLDKLRLIDLLPGNEVRLLTVRNVEWRKDGPMRTQMAQWLTARYFAIDAAKSPWSAELVKLSEASLLRVEDMSREFQRNIRLLGEVDRATSTAQKTWYTVMISADQIDLRGFQDKAPARR
ncbi:MAG: helix-turn-helix transcriptional regulator [Pseudomonadota bacterium]